MALTWAAEQSITQLTTVNQTEQTSTALDLTASYWTKVQVTVNSSGTTDNCIIRVYRSLDDSVYDDIASAEFEVVIPDTNDTPYTFDLGPGERYVKLGAESAGATDTYTVDADYQRLTSV